MSKRKYCLSILALILLGTIKTVQASCAFSPTSTAVKNFTIPLDSRPFSVPTGVAVGYIIARQYVSVTTGDYNRRVICDAGPVIEFRQFGTGTLTLATGFTDVYKTNISGIGFRVYASRTGYPTYPMNFQISPGASYTVIPNLVQSFYIEFVKTAETTGAGNVLANSLPVIENALGQTSSKVVYARFTMSGQFQINVPTCNILPASASMIVQLGTHQASSFSGIGSGTDWKNASIQLTDCSQFFGNRTPSASMYSSRSSYNNGTMTQTTLTANSLSLTLAPRNGVFNAANGIMKIDEETSSATGVGIQLSSSESVSGKINLTNGVKKSIAQDGSTSITIPLYARYIQTESTVGAGKANGRVEYTITYQ